MCGRRSRDWRRARSGHSLSGGETGGAELIGTLFGVLFGFAAADFGFTFLGLGTGGKLTIGPVYFDLSGSGHAEDIACGNAKTNYIPWPGWWKLLQARQ